MDSASLVDMHSDKIVISGTCTRCERRVCLGWFLSQT